MELVHYGIIPGWGDAWFLGRSIFAGSKDPIWRKNDGNIWVVQRLPNQWIVTVGYLATEKTFARQRLYLYSDGWHDTYEPYIFSSKEHALGTFTLYKLTQGPL